MKNQINYSQCWEDVDILKKALNINNTDNILSISSGGDNSLSLLLENPESIVCIDMNQAQNDLLQLKLNSAKNLNYEEYLKILGIRNTNNRGIIHNGKLEKFLNFFRIYLLPLVHSKKEIEKFLTFQYLEEQNQYYNQIWKNRGWNFFIKISTNNFLIKHFARQKEMVKYSHIENPKNNYLNRLDEVIKNNLLNQNSYLEYCLTGNYRYSLPEYATKRSHGLLKNINTNKMKFITTDLLSYLKIVPNDTFNKFNLSDAIESFPENDGEELWSELLRVSKNKAIIVQWCHKVCRTPGGSLINNFSELEDLQKQLSSKDKLFFYKDFHIYEINK